MSPSEKPKRPAGVAGYYVLDDPAQYLAKSMQEVPPGQVRYLAISKDRWLLRDMMNGFGGTLVNTANGAKLTATTGPTGPTSGDWGQIKRTERGVLWQFPAGWDPPNLQFTYISKVVPSGFGLEEVPKTTK